MKRFSIWAGITLFVVLVTALLLLPFGKLSPASPFYRDIFSAKQLGIAARSYAEDHEGQFPTHLSELVPEYVPAEGWDSILFDTRKDIHDPPLPKQDWVYFGAFFDQTNPPPLLIASPQTFGSKTQKRIVVRGDGSADGVKIDEYQELLRKTIEAMHRRFDAAKPAP